MKCPTCDTLVRETDRICFTCRTRLSGRSDPAAAGRMSQLVLASGVCFGYMLTKGADINTLLPFIVCVVVVLGLVRLGMFRR
jgi:hypothetical protein